MANRNSVRQVIKCKDGSEKIIFHKKQTNIPRQYLGIKPVAGSQYLINKAKKEKEAAEAEEANKEVLAEAA